jgi:ATP-dependent exoDNAse (exonuclease V) beta subunit
LASAAPARHRQSAKPVHTLSRRCRHTWNSSSSSTATAGGPPDDEDDDVRELPAEVTIKAEDAAAEDAVEAPMDGGLVHTIFDA